MPVGKEKQRNERPRLNSQPNNYFAGEKGDIQFVSSGCTTFNCALGGGWVLGRMGNIIGDKSTAKTALAWEALTNFLLQYPKGRAAYRETEAAFDHGYAAAMGWPVDKVDVSSDRIPTVEEFERDISRFIQSLHGKPGMYVLDSLDALSDEAELERDAGEGSYGTAKAKALSAMFRKLTAKVEDSKCCLLIISQIRDKIGVKFGEKTTRSGGHAMDFYATHIVKLAHVETLKKTINKVTRPIGITVKAKVTKNKIGLPFREAEFPFLFGYGIDDVTASRDWLKEVHRPHDVPGDELSQVVKDTWREIETSFLPKRSKYGQ